MPTKLQFYTQMADQTAEQITGSYQKWTAFLTTAARLYKYPYHEQLMIFAQRPEATACGSYDLWNHQMRRFVRRGSKGIALVDTSGDNPRLKYVFDVSDTGGGENARRPFLWDYRLEHEAAVSAALEKRFEVTRDSGLPDQLERIAARLADAYWEDNRRDILDIVADSFLEEYDEFNIGVAFKNAAAVSTTYALLSRCGMEPGDYFQHEDFLSVFDFNTPQTVAALGCAISGASEQVLRQIEVTIKHYERERSQNHGEINLYQERGLPDSRPEPAPAGGEASGQVRQDAESVPAGASSGVVGQPAAVREAVPAPAGDRRDGKQPLGADDAGAGAGGGSHGSPESQRPHDLGGADEQLQGAGGGTDSQRAGLQLTFGETVRGEQLSMFPTEAEQIQTIAEAESVTQTPFAFSISQTEIDHILRLGGNADDARMRLVTEFSKGKSTGEMAAILRELYHGGSGIITDRGSFAAWYGEDGIRIAQGDSARYSTKAQLITWEDAAKRMEALLEAGEFATNVELAEAPGYERRQLAQSIWYLYHDLSDTAKEAGSFPSLSGITGSGYPEETTALAVQLESPEFREKLIAECLNFVDAYRQDRDLLRFHYHRPEELLTRLQELNLPRRKYATEMAELSKLKTFITEDEIDATLSRGSNMEGSKGRIYAYFSEPHTDKEQADFLKEEYGIGGSSHAVSGATHSSEDHSGKGISLKKQNCTEVQLNWNKAAQRITNLIRKDRFLSPKEKEQLEALHRENVVRAAAYQDYNAIKESYPDDLVLYQMGDFFELYGEDAKQAAEVLDLNLASRRIDGIGRIQFCGIPTHQLEYAVEKLQGGHAVTIASKDENGKYNISPMSQVGIEKVEPAQPPIDRPITQADIDDALRKWNGDMDSKRSVVRYMAEHGREKETAAWLSREYGGPDTKSLFFTRSGSEESVELSWAKVQKRIAQLIQRDDFFTDEEKDHFEDIDPVAIREHLESGESSPFVEQVMADVERITQAHDNAVSQLTPWQQTVVQAFETAGFRYNPAQGDIRFDADTDGYPLTFASWTEAYEGIDGAELKLEPGLREQVQAILHPDTATRMSDAEFARDNLIPGETTFEMDGRTFLVDRVNLESGTVNFQDITFASTTGFPIFRTEPISRIRAYLEQKQPEMTTETVAVYPAEENHLPYAVIVERLHVEEPEHTPPTPVGNSVSIPVDGEWQEFPNAQAAKQAAYEEYKANIRRNAQNFHIEDEHLGEGGPKAKFQANLNAIRLLKELEASGSQALPEQQEVLSRYVGWGGLADAFDETKPAWAEEFKELSAVLTSEEYAAARSSTLNAHYTSPTVIRAIYEAVEKMGFRTGNILEPSCGVGNFFGMLPESMAASRLYGVELDSITGRIAKQLYPKADITVAGFETTDRRDFYDLAIGNVPFGQYQVNDPAYNKLGFNIHNYFLAKALDQVRPGGVVAFVTSRYTMDAKDSTVRRYLAQRADLLGAIRLPNNAFKANAGTEVVSDILFLQKRDRPLELAPEWTQVGQNEDGFAINNYFLTHPEMVLGRQTQESTAHGMDYTVEPIEGLLLADQLHDAVKYIGGTYREAELPELGEGETVDTSIPADPNVKNFSFAVVDGEVYYRENSRMVKPELNATARERVRGMVELRDCVQKLIAQQMDGATPDSDIRETQRTLNTLYDRYTEKYSLINSRANALAFGEDSSYYLLCSLEVLDEDNNLQRKADMFTKRTIKPHEAVTSVDTASEALALSVSEKARVDLPYMAELTGFSEEKLVDDLRGVIFRDFGDLVPEEIPKAFFRLEEFGYVTADEYLSGNVREKLRLVEHIAGFLPEAEAAKLQPNIDALRAAQPKDLDASEIEVRLGATWIDKEYIRQFMLELLDPPYYLRRSLDVNFSPVTAEWNISGKSSVGYGNINAHMTYGTERMSAYKILEDTLNLRDVRIYDTKTDPDGKERRVLNSKETTLAQQKQQTIKDAFQEWVWKDPDRRRELVAKYNEIFNSSRPREYDGSHITFSGMNPEISLRPHQRNAVAHILYGGNTLLAHQVGAGKTFEMVSAAMESKRLGLCQKPLFAVPNHLIEQWAAEFLRLYPSANILVATKKDFETKNRKKFCARIATGDYDAVILGHSQFEKIPISRERQERLLQEQIDEIEDGLTELKASRAERFTIKGMERTRKSLEAKLQKLQDSSRKDDVITFEQLGVDRLYVDEAHNYKNMFLYTKMRNVAGLSTTDAQKSSDMYLKCRYLDEVTGGKGIVFATGTPVSNSMTELFTMMRYLQHDTIQKKGLSHFDCWASTFGETTTAIELAPEGTGYRARTRFSKFFNLPELMTLFKEAADIKTADQLHLPTPTPVYHNVVAQPTEIQKAMVQELSERAAKVHAGIVDPSADNMLRITSDGRKLGLDQRIINPDLPDDPTSKVNQCVDNIFRIWREGEADKLTQLVFSDLSTPKTSAQARKASKAAAGSLDSPEIHALEMLADKDGTPDEKSFTIYDDIREKLVARGIPREQVVFIHEANTEARKKELFAKVRSGQVRVLLGSTFKMGSGMNVQDRLIALHDLDAPWRPGDLEQRSGRIIRQGNRNPEVHIYRYVTESTFDAYLWQTLENKQKFISQIMTSKSPVRSCEDIDETALSYAEIKALCAGDERIKEKMDLDVDVARLKLMRANHQSQQYRLEDNILRYFPEQIEQCRGYIAGFEADMKTLAEHPHPKDGFAGMEVKGDALTDKDNAGAALLEALKEVKGMEPVPIGTYRGFAMSLTLEDFGQDYVLTLKGQMSHRVSLGKDARGNLTRIDNALNGIPERQKAAQDKLDNLYAQLETAKGELGKPFPQEQELRTKSARLAELNIALNIDDKTPMERLAGEDEIAKSARPSVLAQLRAPLQQTTPAKPKTRETEAR